MNMMTNTRAPRSLMLLSNTATTTAKSRLDLKSCPSEQDSFTVKIVLTMTLKARDAEHAQILAEHVAAFVPEDADRLTEAFSPVLTAPGEMSAKSPRHAQARSATQAEVVAVVPGALG